MEGFQTYIDALKEIFKNKKLLFVAVVLVVVVLIIFLWSLNGGQARPQPGSVSSEPVEETLGTLPKPQALLPLIPQSTPSATQVFIDSSTVALPTTARVYRFNETSTLTFTKMDRLAVKLGFTSKPQDYVNGSLLWQEGQSYLQYDVKNDGFTFYLADASSSATLKGQTKAQTVSNFLSFSELKFPDLQIADNNPTITLEGQNLYLVPRIVNDIPISSLPFDLALTFFTFDQSGNLQSGAFYYQMLQSGEDASGVYSLRTLSEALNLLKSGQGTLMRLGINDYHIVDIKGITSASFTGVSLVYYETKQPQQFLRPYYSFTGTVTLVDGRTTEATYFVAAL